MNKRRLGKSELYVSEISFGCWTMGGLSWVNGKSTGWASVDEAEITAGIACAIEAGVNHFDTADVYGNGEAERMLARVFTRLGANSRNFVIASKVGHFPGTAEHAYEATHIRHQCEQSLINLKREYLDVYYFHHANFGENDRYLDEAVATMDALVAEGKVRVKGLSAYSTASFEKYAPIVKPDVLQSWAHALDDQFIRSGSRMQTLMERENVSFVAFSPLAQGRLLDKYDPKSPPIFESGDNRQNKAGFSAEAIAELAPKLAKVKERFGATTEDLAAVALGYVLAHPHVACVIPGFRNERQARCNTSAYGKVLTAEELAFIRETLA